MAWFKKSINKLTKTVKVPEGLWIKCNSCKEIIYRKEVDRNLKICPKCNYHFRISAKERISLLVDEDSFIEIGKDITSQDPLNFKDFHEQTGRQVASAIEFQKLAPLTCTNKPTVDDCICPSQLSEKGKPIMRHPAVAQ